MSGIDGEAPASLATRRQFGAASIAALAGAVGSPSIADPPAGAVADAPPAADAASPLANYCRRRDSSTRWDAVGAGTALGGRWRTVQLVSQTWRGTEWTHELSVYRPDAVAQDSGTMLLWIDGGKATDMPQSLGEAGSGALPALAAVANAAGLPAAVVRQVPFQPLFEGLVEDQLIAESFVQFAGTGDATWPLLVPMVKTAVEAMTAAATLARKHWGQPVERFVVTGASKRGWTTWLTAAVDPRVCGIVPMVIDMLSLERHVALQHASFGGLSEKLEDYTSRGIDALLPTPRGRELAAIVDPYAYRRWITQPKLILLGANDPYWPLESLGLYYGDLSGPNWVSYCPNAGHGLPMPRVAGLVAAMGRHTAGIERLPDLRWTHDRSAAKPACVVRSDVLPERLLLWQATAATRDFREARWSSTVVDRGPEAGAWTVPLPRTQERWSAAFVEVEYRRQESVLPLTTDVVVSAPGDRGS